MIQDHVRYQASVFLLPICFAGVLTGNCRGEEGENKVCAVELILLKKGVTCILRPIRSSFNVHSVCVVYRYFKDIKEY
jgi:hypothetical protein